MKIIILIIILLLLLVLATLIKKITCLKKENFSGLINYEKIETDDIFYSDIIGIPGDNDEDSEGLNIYKAVVRSDPQRGTTEQIGYAVTFNPSEIKKMGLNNAIKVISGTETTDNGELVPFLFDMIKKQYKIVIQLSDQVNSLNSDLYNLAKKVE